MANNNEDFPGITFTGPITVNGPMFDIHDNGAVNIHMNGSERNNANPTLDESLASPMAMKYWKRLEEQGFVGPDGRLTADTSRRQAMYIADLFSDKLKLKTKWKPFEKLWGIKNLAQEKYQMQETGAIPRRYKDIDKAFTD